MVALMAPKHLNGHDRKRLVPLLMAVAGLCTFFYFLGGGGKTCPVLVTDGDLGYDMDTLKAASEEKAVSNNVFEPCDSQLTDYTPCQDQHRALRFPRDHYAYRERHCPRNDEMLRCLIPPPAGYAYPFPWPESRQYAWFANAPHKHLAVEKAVQNWIRLKGDKFFFPGGGTTFPDGADVYLKQLAELIPLADGSIRTALDTGCGVASFGAYLFDYNVVTMSFAPRDTHEAQVQFALERGVPAVLGIMATRRQPYPSGAFDLIHCSRCLIPWTADDGLYLKEVDRMLRPGGYWVLSGPPVNWQKRWRGWDGTQETFQRNMTDIEDLASKLCWKVSVKAGDPGSGDFAVFQKPVTRECYATLQPEVLCPSGEDPNVAWETPMKSCISEPSTNATETPKWPQRLTVPPVRLNEISGLSLQAFERHNAMWRERLKYYKKVALGELKERKRKIRNIMDMNAGYGGLAAALALDEEPVWVMNVVPSHIVNTLPVIYDRGLIGTYMNWCEAFSTYPRTYDLLHAAGLFGLYSGRCDIIDILLEMDRVLRPEGLVIIRDEQRIVGTVSKIARGLRWEVAMVDAEQGSTEKILVCHKKYWVSS